MRLIISPVSTPSANGSGFESNQRPHARPLPGFQRGQRHTLASASVSVNACSCLHGVCGRAGSSRAIGSARRPTRAPHVAQRWNAGDPRAFANVGAGQHRTRSGSGPGSGVGHP